MMMKGLIHIYCGDGKGKTTASLGLSVRAVGAGKRVLYVQFFKDGSSSECKVLETLLTFQRPEESFGFFRTLTEEQRQAAKRFYTAHLQKAIDRAGDYDLLVLDEIISTVNHGVVEESMLLAFLEEKPEGLEVVLTGRDPSEALQAKADYITEMCKRKHPFDTGTPARFGIEF